MSAPVLDPAAFEYGLPAAELDHLQATIVERLRRAGVRLPDAEVTAIADEVLADVVRICLAWMEPS
jgi:hypothetical protein